MIDHASLLTPTYFVNRRSRCRKSRRRNEESAQVLLRSVKRLDSVTSEFTARLDSKIVASRHPDDMWHHAAQCFYHRAAWCSLVQLAGWRPAQRVLSSRLAHGVSDLHSWPSHLASQRWSSPASHVPHVPQRLWQKHTHAVRWQDYAAPPEPDEPPKEDTKFIENSRNK